MLSEYEKMEISIALCNALKAWQKDTFRKKKSVPFEKYLYEEKILLCDIPEVCNYIEMMINYKFGGDK